MTAELEKQIHDINQLVQQARPFAALAESFDGVIGLAKLYRERKGDLEVYHCVDASEIVQYLIPLSLGVAQGKYYPRPLDIALAALFDDAGPETLYVTAVHAREASGVLNTHVSRLTDARTALNALSSLLAPQLESLDPLDSNTFREYLRLIRSYFGKLYALSHRVESDVFEQYRRRLKEGRLITPSGKQLGIPGWQYTPNAEHIRAWYAALGKAEPSPSRRMANSVDAHSLDFIAGCNSELPENKVMIFYTHVQKIWDAVKTLDNVPGLTRDLEDGGKVSLIHHPGTAAIRLFSLESVTTLGASDKQLSVLSERGERARSLVELIGRLENCVAYLKDRKKPSDDVTVLTNRLRQRIPELDQTLSEWRNLALARLHYSDQIASPKVHLSKICAPPAGFGPKDLRDLLTENMAVVDGEIEGLRERISWCFSDEPTSPIELIELEANHSLGLTSKPTFTTYTYEYVFFPSEVRSQLETLRELLEPAAQQDQAKSHRSRQAAMYRAEGKLGEQPEFFLMLSFFYATQNQWLLARDSAEQGLLRLWPTGLPRLQEDPPPQHEAAVTTCELLLASGAAVRRLAQKHYDLPQLLKQWLKESANRCFECLARRKAWSLRLEDDTLRIGERDHRCLRELSVIHMMAAELKVPIARDLLGEDLAEEEQRARRLFEVGAELALEGGELAHDDVQRAMCENNRLYGLTRLATTERALEQCRAIAERLEASEYSEDLNILDTLASYYYQRARLAPDDATRKEAMGVATDYIERAMTQVQDANPFARFLTRAHAKEILNE